ncbi:uncharacterized protein LOC143196228 [Rhynchophorus ferrugineus]|uniref:Uncharacterized protein n=1 Tax=Rhynchophorus ferrugineus TaxID=354439 RepID=A0A834INQ5_RHYFE|nr:hypothetical protein GWI33_000940 [Rhynchophorus ferrugineus]
MPFNVMIQLCRVTRASKLFQRNFYLPLLKPLSPREALRKRIITGKDVLPKALEHWIPVLEEYAVRVARRKRMPKGRGKKRQRQKDTMKYVTPVFDHNLPFHTRLDRIVSGKSTGRGQCYTYYIPEKKCTLVLTHQMERAVRDKDIVDILIAQRHEKILVKLRDGFKFTMPLRPYTDHVPIYRGEGWTKKEVEEYHHHGHETFSIAQMFEAKEAGIEDWEMEMIRLANARKKKLKGEESKDWRAMLQSTVENMDWEEFEEEAKQIVTEVKEVVEDQPIAMAVDDMDKTCNVNEKLKAAGPEVLNMLPAMPEIPEILKVLKDQSEMTELAQVSGARVSLDAGKDRFVPGQMVTSEEGELFVPGQTVVTETGEKEYTPGFTVLMDGEPTLIPGLVMGEDPNKAMFLPGEAAITEEGELQFAATEDDVLAHPPTPPPPEPVEPEEPDEPEEAELDEVQDSAEEEIEFKPPPPRQRKEFVYERPKRQYNIESMGPKHRERGSRRAPAPPPAATEAPKPATKPKKHVPRKVIEFTQPVVEKDLLVQLRERVASKKEKRGKEEAKVDRARREIRLKARKLIESQPPPPKYEPLEPVRKSERLRELEQSIKQGDFFVDYKKYLNRERDFSFNWLEKYQYRHTFDSVGIQRHRVWKSVF